MPWESRWFQSEIEEIRNNFADVVFLSSNKEEFLENLDKAVNSNNEDRINKGYGNS